MGLEPVVPLRVRLVWNESEEKCRVHVGRFFCGYDSEGLGRALHRFRIARNLGLYRAEIDASGDVKMQWVVGAISALRKADIWQVDFCGRANPLGDEQG